ncbi:MAG: inorganic phosphate transporter [Syntrophomonadaceae bacterium]|nr:inorganic phosphate transporter [Syntrophomonadaceae bacterium]
MLDILLLILVVVLALIFDYVNGFHDTANAIATSVTTRALSPRTAIILAAGLNFLGALSGTAVAKTIGSSIIKPGMVDEKVLILALAGAIVWNLFTWYFGIPSSSSHALIGGLTGASVAMFGIHSVNWPGLGVIVFFLIASTVVGLVVGALVMTVLSRVFRGASPNRMNTIFRRLQVLSACMMAFSHGSNDAQKSMGIITMALLSAGYISTFHVPAWVMLACATAMGLGTAAGGWRIIAPLGSKIFRIEPINGFAADFSSSVVIYTASVMGYPVSTTHVVSSSIIGVGCAKQITGVRWETARRLVTAWLITIPTTAFISLIFYKLLELCLGAHI